MTYSAAVELAWRMAAAIARRRQTLIEPEQILYSIFSLSSQDESLQLRDEETKKELDDVADAFAKNGLPRSEVVRRLRPRMEGLEHDAATPAKPRTVITRSDECKRVFDLAVSIAAKESLDCAYLRHLVAGILTCCPDVLSTLGIDQQLTSAILVALSRVTKSPPLPHSVRWTEPTPPETAEVVLHAVDASKVVEAKIDWKLVGPKFSELCDLTWRSGAAGSLEELLQSAAERIVVSVPRATHSAILILDTQTGDFLLKANHPRGEVLVSKSLAQQALHQKEAFIWQRQQTMSESQLESGFESGIYAPVIADDVAFGVLCLNTKSAASLLTKEDLFLATFLGHQIGLVLANRKLKTEVLAKITLLERLMTNFSPQVRTHLIKRAEAGRLKLGGQRSNVTILCADIRGFTAMAAAMDTDDLLLLLNDYFVVMVECVFRHEGTVDKFMGDALLAVFGSPEPNARHTQLAVNAAVAMQAAIQKVSERRKANGEIACEIGIGVHTGEVVHGFIGSVDRMEFTIIGDAVNMTSRYCSGAGPAEIIVSPQVHEKVWRDVKVQPVELATKHEGPLHGYRLLCMRVKQGSSQERNSGKLF